MFFPVTAQKGRENSSFHTHQPVSTLVLTNLSPFQDKSQFFRRILEGHALLIHLYPPPLDVSSVSLLFKKKIYWSIADLHCCVSFRCMAKSVINIYKSIPFQIHSHISYYTALSNFLVLHSKSLLLIYFKHGQKI